jgi:hypothetical protein
MKRLARILLALVVVGVLAAMTGCGAIVEKAVKSGVEGATGVKVDKSGTGVTVTGKDGSSLTSSADGTLPEGFPSDMPLYQNAKITTGLASDSGTGKAFVVALTTTDAPADVLAWYESQLKDKGWNVTSTMKTGDGGLLGGEKGTSAFTLAVTNGSGDAGTEISISVSPKS